jgi:hypothetical protein
LFWTLSTVRFHASKDASSFIFKCQVLAPILFDPVRRIKSKRTKLEYNTNDKHISRKIHIPVLLNQKAESVWVIQMGIAVQVEVVFTLHSQTVVAASIKTGSDCAWQPFF